MNRNMRYAGVGVGLSKV